MNKTIDFATYRYIQFPEELPFSVLHFPNHYRYCLVVPKTYNRIFHEQVIWPYAIDLWILVFGFSGFFLVYRFVLESILRQYFPSAFRIINTPLHLLRILLLFLLSEYYTAMLTANLGQSNVSTYPRTLEAFEKSQIPLLVTKLSSFQYFEDHPEIGDRAIEINASRKYDPTWMSLVQMCELFPYTIAATTKGLGKELDHHHYHLIKDPIKSTVGSSPFRQTSPLLHRFQSYVTRLYEAGIWDHLVNKWTLSTRGTLSINENDSVLRLEHFLPVYIIGGYLYLIATVVFLVEIAVHTIQMRA
ncbi:uncharacterized protein LOC118464573 [Anopheles albimanus]|uniref:uncharacterized protein LOC118464573 n=1 Tax=Anopheles albimanus TaxID=7167 RepID=UPI00163DFF5E|nr:uncharacterized protein LOC118464573 [Anopheles albimanus]